MADELKKVRRQSNRFAVILVIEIGFCAMFYFACIHFFAAQYIMIYYLALLALPLAANVYWYFRSHSRNDALGKHYAVITQVIVWIFYWWYLL